MKRMIAVLFVICVFLVSCNRYTVIDNETSKEVGTQTEPGGYEYVINTSTKKYHTQFCSYTLDIDENSKVTSSDISFYTERGYSPCSRCISR